jgi:hypothetical protein
VIRRPTDALTLDLHSLPAHEALDVFVNFYNRQVSSGSRSPIEVVHGYGSSGAGGVIRKKLRSFLQANSTFLSYTTGESRDGNPGYTLVYPNMVLPSQQDALSTEILAYCTIARSEEKVAGKFRKFGDIAVQTALKNLERQSRLSSQRKGKLKCYTTN